MTYTDRFIPLDGLIVHMDVSVPGLDDPILKSQYVGFLNVAVVTVWELSIKAIFLDFANKKHGSFGTYCGNVLERMNGRISIKDLKEMHVRRFGDKYLTKFSKKLDELERAELAVSGTSIKSSYGNIVVWRNSFAHEGVLPPNASYAETRKGYECGKLLLQCLASSMVR